MKKKPQKKRPRLVVLLCCDGVANDPNSNKKTLYGVHDQIIPGSLSDFILRIYARFADGEDAHQIGFGLRDKKGAIAWQSREPLEMKFKAGRPRELAAVITQVRVPRAGDYELFVRCDNRAYSNITYPIKIHKPKSK